MRNENPCPQLGYTALNLGIRAQRGDSPVTGICPLAVSLAIHSSCHGILPIFSESILQLTRTRTRGTMASMSSPPPRVHFPTKTFKMSHAKPLKIHSLPPSLGSRGCAWRTWQGQLTWSRLGGEVGAQAACGAGVVTEPAAIE